MAKFKLSITYEFDYDHQEDAVDLSQALLRLIPYSHNVSIALLRDGDRSGANLLSPINEKHYKHGKISLTEYIERISNVKKS